MNIWCSFIPNDEYEWTLSVTHQKYECGESTLIRDEAGRVLSFPTAQEAMAYADRMYVEDRTPLKMQDWKEIVFK